MTSPRARFVALEDAGPSEAVVVIDVLRAFTTVAWAVHRGAARVLAVGSPEHALALRDSHLPQALVAGEVEGRRAPGFDMGNSPSELLHAPLSGRTIVHRTSAGTQGLMRTRGSGLVLAASFVTAGATARALRAAGVDEVVFVVTGASLGRDGDEDLACAELITARLAGRDPDPAEYLSRVAASDAGRVFGPDGPAWAPAADLHLACEVDRFDFHLHAHAAPEPDAVEVRAVAATGG